MRFLFILMSFLFIMPLAASAECDSSQIVTNATNYCYDALGRLTGVIYGKEAETKYKYDAAGNREQVDTQVHLAGLDTECGPRANQLDFTGAGGTTWKHCVTCAAQGVEKINTYAYSSALDPKHKTYSFGTILPSSSSTQSFEVTLISSQRELTNELTASVGRDGRVTFRHINVENGEYWDTGRDHTGSISCPGMPDDPWVWNDSEFTDKIIANGHSFSSINPQQFISDVDSDVSKFEYSWSSSGYSLDYIGLTQNSLGRLSGTPTPGLHTLNLTVTDPYSGQTATRSLKIHVNTECDPGARQLDFTGAGGTIWKHCVTCAAQGVAKINTYAYSSALDPNYKTYSFGSILPSSSSVQTFDVTIISSQRELTNELTASVGRDGRVTFRHTNIENGVYSNTIRDHEGSISCPGMSDEPWAWNESQFNNRTVSYNGSFASIDPRHLVNDPDSDVTNFEYSWSKSGYSLDYIGLTQNSSGRLSGTPIPGAHTLNLRVTDPKTGQSDMRSLRVTVNDAPYGKCGRSGQMVTFGGSGGTTWKHCVTCAGGRAHQIKTYATSSVLTPSSQRYRFSSISRGGARTRSFNVRVNSSPDDLYTTMLTANVSGSGLVTFKHQNRINGVLNPKIKNHSSSVTCR